MKWLLIIIFPIKIFAQDVPEIISIKDYNPQKKYDKPICIVDMYGEMECKYPPEKQTIKEPVPVEKKEEKPLFYPAKNQGWESSVSFTGIGSFKGVGFDSNYRNNDLSYGGGFKLNIYTPMVTEDEEEIDYKPEMMVYGEVVKHVLPRWYTHSKSQKRFDLGVSFKLGYNHISEQTDVSRKSSPFVGIGLKATYPISTDFKLLLGVDAYQNSSLKSIGNGGHLGIGFDF